MTDTIHNLDLDTAAAEWSAAKDAELAIVARRRKLEDHMIALIGVPIDAKGVQNIETDAGKKIKVTCRLNKKVNSDLLQEIAAEHGIYDELSKLFRWKPEIVAAAWEAAPTAITNPLTRAITTTPGRPSFAINKDD